MISYPPATFHLDKNPRHFSTSTNMWLVYYGWGGGGGGEYYHLPKGVDAMAIDILPNPLKIAFGDFSD